MEELINKPRVFLSHSKKNSEFIERLANDLRKCQIDPWLDTDQIRHGKSWQDSIFEYGLPTCDAVIVYFTELSIQSQVVKKEMDVALLQNLEDNNIAFLPYVSDEKLRRELRPDIQALQVLEWNDKNYSSMLPKVVAEIWRSYLERTLSSTMKEERLKRVQAELELEKYKNQPDDVFSTSESKEYEFIWNSFKKITLLEMIGSVEMSSETDPFSERMVSRNMNLDLSSVVALLSDFLAGQYYSATPIYSALYNVAKELLNSQPMELDVSLQNITIPKFSGFTEELLTHGLVERYTYTSRSYDSEYLEEKLELSKKYYRFRFWLAYHQKLPDRVFIEMADKDWH